MLLCVILCGTLRQLQKKRNLMTSVLSVARPSAPPSPSSSPYSSTSFFLSALFCPSEATKRPLCFYRVARASSRAHPQAAPCAANVGCRQTAPKAEPRTPRCDALDHLRPAPRSTPLLEGSRGATYPRYGCSPRVRQLAPRQSPSSVGRASPRGALALCYKSPSQAPSSPTPFSTAALPDLALAVASS